MPLFNKNKGQKPRPPLEVVSSIRTLTILEGERSASEHFDFRTEPPWRSTLGALDSANLSTQGTLVLRVNDGPIASLASEQTQRGLVSIVQAGLDGDSYRGLHIRTLGVYFDLGEEASEDTVVRYSLRGWPRS